jgi:DNA primase
VKRRGSFTASAVKPGKRFHFLAKYDQLSFPEAVERVAKRYGIKIESIRWREGPGRAERESLYRINERAANYHQILLVSRPGEKLWTI